MQLVEEGLCLCSGPVCYRGDELMSTFITVGRSDRKNLATNLVWSKQIYVDLISLILFSLTRGKRNQALFLCCGFSRASNYFE